MECVRLTRPFVGSNGRVYRFLLKGHEDLRQDERVMQLFGLVNALLSNDPETSKRDLLIKWVSPCLLCLICDVASSDAVAVTVVTR